MTIEGKIVNREGTVVLSSKDGQIDKRMVGDIRVSVREDVIAGSAGVVKIDVSPDFEGTGGISGMGEVYFLPYDGKVRIGSHVPIGGEVKGQIIEDCGRNTLFSFKHK